MNFKFENEIVKVFQSTQNSYKYYWWYSLLHLVKCEKRRSFTLHELAIQMIVFSWYPVNYYKLSLGKQDQLSKHIRDLKSSFNELNDDIADDALFVFLNRNSEHIVVKEILNKLTKYVPFRFIRPWFDETVGIPDGMVHQQILSLQDSKLHLTPYFIDLSKNQIILNPDWFDWVYTNIKIIESFTLFELFKYVEKNNPYVTNISLKLFKPELRKLSEPAKLWKSFIELKGNETKSVFENKPLTSLNKIAIDHYLPWSLVTHDKLWNLHPIEQDVNSSKSNKIADNKYLSEFTKLQFEFVQHLKSLNTKYLEDYFVLFSISKNELLTMSNHSFKELLGTKNSIETDLARNLGYNTKWSYSNQH